MSTTIPPIIAFDELDSTNAEARRRAEAGETGPVWLTAGRQTAGRGRRGRNWETGQGRNLAATLLLTTQRPPAEAAQISFVAALAVADLADAFVPPSIVTLKWPNDPLISGTKASGVLIESGPAPGGGLWLAIGIGVNLAEAPLNPERPATTFAAHMTAPPPAPLDALNILAASFARWLDLWDRLGFPAVAEAWTRRAHGLGEPCVARLGTETLHGVAEGLDPDGAFRLRLPDGMLRRITAGDVFFGET
ncbi:biotin--[acetyl-CoA-carboxylase] ligase [Caulobacter sp. SLTY]|uniref:biotin--[acetyl-CoA-carboxylase] ligase n=1 Tax=Caulobacter sp. SLTY TaxID=2683262 RepID=UPI0014123D52|nr:biotin--[acetyl-CoA-carboxylase] ligase [Caulobacter sp. SLTY]NBB17132.1 biotin--[acetyl-CoA-carboxylase] ligase [Caulobacter sp. SLTY]